MFYFQVFGSHERWSTWLPNLCGTLVQGSIFVMCCYYSYGRVRREVDEIEEVKAADTVTGTEGNGDFDRPDANGKLDEPLLGGEMRDAW